MKHTKCPQDAENSVIYERPRTRESLLGGHLVARSIYIYIYIILFVFYFLWHIYIYILVDSTLFSFAYIYIGQRK